MSDPNSQFVRLISKHHQAIWNYILTIHPNRADADDIMQETATCLWNKFQDFDPAIGDFLQWAYRFAYYEVLRYRKTLSRSKLLFNDELLEQISRTQESVASEMDPRSTILSTCISKLSDSDQQILEERYETHSTIAALSIKLNIPAKRLYKRLEKIRIILFRCVDIQLNKEGAFHG